MFGYNPYSGYDPYSSANPYLRALAEERAARRAQQESQARQRFTPPFAGASPYASFLNDEDEGGVDDPFGRIFHSPFARERERRRSSDLEERGRLELLRREQQERERERLRLLEEQRRREIEAQERRRRAIEEMYRRGRVFPGEGQEEEDEEALHPIPHRRAASASPFPSHPGHRKPASPSPSRPPAHAIPIPIRTHSKSPLSSPSHSPSPSPGLAQPKSSPSPSPQPKIPTPAPEQTEAAIKIQSAYRQYAHRRSALSQIDQIRQQFQTLKSSFRMPAKVDFTIEDGKVVTVDTTKISTPNTPLHPDPTTFGADRSIGSSSSQPKLAFTPNNVPLHAYDEELNRLLGKLDAIESGGDGGVREKRKGCVRDVESEAVRIEGWRRVIWDRFRESEDAERKAGEQVEEEDKVEEEERKEVVEEEKSNVGGEEGLIIPSVEAGADGTNAEGEAEPTTTVSPAPLEEFESTPTIRTAEPEDQVHSDTIPIPIAVVIPEGHAEMNIDNLDVAPVATLEDSSSHQPHPLTIPTLPMATTLTSTPSDAYLTAISQTSPIVPSLSHDEDTLSTSTEPALLTPMTEDAHILMYVDSGTQTGDEEFELVAVPTSMSGLKRIEVGEGHEVEEEIPSLVDADAKMFDEFIML